MSTLLEQASLVMIPSGYKGGKAYAEIPTNGNGDLTWTRASDAWRTNADGLIQRVPWNLSSYSEAFDNAAWSLDGVTISANQIASPTGTTTADLMTSNGTGQQRIFQVYTVSANSPYTISIYVKQGTTSTIQIVMPYVGAGPTFTFSTATFNTVSGWTSSVETLANGWYRISVTNTPTTTQAGFQLALPSNGSSVYLWGAQFNQGSSAQTYFPTTDRLNVPRLSYMYGSCPALLLEPQRTNLALYSEDFSSASWVKVGSSVTANSTTSPSGVQDADTFSGDGILGGHELRQTISFINGTTYTFSVYAKKNTNNFLQLIAGSAAFGLNVWANFDLNNGIVGTVGSSTTASIQNVGNGWYRCVITGAASVTSSAFVVPFLISSATSIRGESNTLSTSVYLWGAQVEAGSYVTTLIPTTTASATRIADSFSRNNIYTNGLITSSGGTWFVELRGNLSLKGDVAGDGIFLQTVGNTDNFRLYGESASSSRIIIYKRVSNVNTLLYTTTTDTTKLAIKWNGSTADVFANGTKVVSATTFTATQMQDFVTSINATPKFIQAMGLHPTPLTDAQCIELTTL